PRWRVSRRGSLRLASTMPGAAAPLCARADRAAIPSRTRLTVEIRTGRRIGMFSLLSIRPSRELWPRRHLLILSEDTTMRRPGQYSNPRQRWRRSHVPFRDYTAGALSLFSHEKMVKSLLSPT